MIGWLVKKGPCGNEHNETTDLSLILKLIVRMLLVHLIYFVIDIYFHSTEPLFSDLESLFWQCSLRVMRKCPLPTSRLALGL